VSKKEIVQILPNGIYGLNIHLESHTLGSLGYYIRDNEIFAKQWFGAANTFCYSRVAGVLSENGGVISLPILQRQNDHGLDSCSFASDDFLGEDVYIFHLSNIRRYQDTFYSPFNSQQKGISGDYSYYIRQGPNPEKNSGKFIFIKSLK
jgi:hypothetical protein